MVREVRAADGRNWTVRREIHWARSANEQQFEHDVSVSQLSGFVMMGLVVAMVVAVAIWTPPGVYLPGWLIVVLVVVVLLVPAQWALTRPWLIEADTFEPLNSSGEHWEGTIRGLRASRHEASRVIEQLQTYGSPVLDEAQGPLFRVSDQPRLP
ncbi:MAG: DUF983 domain-containing protein [Pseudonocardiaceae bacterium]